MLVHKNLQKTTKMAISQNGHFEKFDLHIEKQLKQLLVNFHNFSDVVDIKKCQKLLEVDF